MLMAVLDSLDTVNVAGVVCGFEYPVVLMLMVPKRKAEATALFSRSSFHIMTFIST